MLLLVVHDQDSWDCKRLKTKLIERIESAGEPQTYKIRIACRELENWYLGDLQALEQVYPNSSASRLQNKARYRQVDTLTGTVEMRKITSDFSKMYCARTMGPIINLENNRSASFRQFLSGLQTLLAE